MARGRLWGKGLYWLTLTWGISLPEGLCLPWKRVKARLKRVWKTDLKALWLRRAWLTQASVCQLFLKASKTPRFLSEVACSYQLWAIVSSEGTNPNSNSLGYNCVVWSKRNSESRNLNLFLAPKMLYDTCPLCILVSGSKISTHILPRHKWDGWRLQG